MYGPVRVIKSVGHQDGAAKADSTRRGVLLQNLHVGKNDAPQKRKIMEPGSNSILKSKRLDLNKIVLAAAKIILKIEQTCPQAKAA